MRTLTGDDAVRAAGALLPRLNHGGGNAAQIQNAVGIVEEARSSEELLKDVARELATHSARVFGNRGRLALKRATVASRLALEMMAHEESERIALEGELDVLEEAWRAADEIAAIADDMFLPASVDEELARLKGARSTDPGQT